MLRDRLYDVDLLIRRSLVYGALPAMIAALYTGSVVLFGWLARVSVGWRDNSRAIDRRFYRRGCNAARTLQAFADVARQEVDLSRLSERLVEVVERTMEPAHISLTLLLPRQPEEEPPAGAPRRSA